MMRATSRMLALGIVLLTPTTGLAGWLAPEHTCSSNDVVELLKNVHRKYSADAGEISINAVATTLKRSPNNGDTCKATLKSRDVGPFATFTSERTVLYSYQLTDDGKSIYVNILDYGQINTKTEVTKEQAEAKERETQIRREEARAVEIAKVICRRNNPREKFPNEQTWQFFNWELDKYSYLSDAAVIEDYERFVKDGTCPDWRQYIGKNLVCERDKKCVLSGQREADEKKQPDYSSVREDDPYFCTHRNEICLKSGISAKTCEAEMKACVSKR